MPLSPFNDTSFAGVWYTSSPVLKNPYTTKTPMSTTGTAFLIVHSNGAVHQCAEGASYDTAVAKATELAGTTRLPAYILKPVAKIAPKVDVTITEL